MFIHYMKVLAIKPQVYTLLEEYRIGNLNTEDVKENDQLASENDPYLMEPKRNPGLVVNKAKPFNAETPLEVLDKHFYTPNEWFYIRSHLPTPDVTADEYELECTFEDGKDEKVFSLSDLKTKFEKVEMASTIQCGGNRRAEMNEVKPIKGLMWKGGAIGNAKWGGVRLSDILKDYNLNGIKHVWFEGYDEGSDGEPYGASIPIGKAISGDVLLAYEMNDEDLPRDHGYPIRVVATGIVGARNVKWLRRIVLRHMFYQSILTDNAFTVFIKLMELPNGPTTLTAVHFDLTEKN
jgi:sulfite oxidase